MGLYVTPLLCWGSKEILMNELAVRLQEQICSVNPTVYEMLSGLGKRMYFPSKGILSQSAEAKKLAGNFNATIGTALENKTAMNLPCVMDSLPGIPPNDALLYAPSYGIKSLREAWKAKILHDNPSLAGVPFSLPVVTNGLTQALSLVGDLFVDPGDVVLMPDLNWDNYLLNFDDRLQADLRFFPLFNRDGGMGVDGLKALLDQAKPGEKRLVILNFPNNPTGYTPSEAEGQTLADALLAAAERGVRIVALVDDAYFGLFYAPDSMKQSLFVKLANRSRNLVAIKADAATKECYVWGLRVGFLSFAVGGADSDDCPLFSALEAKAAGEIRATVSNCSALSQRVVDRALRNPAFYDQREHCAQIMRERYQETVKVFQDHPEYAEHFRPYPFNSGYFMCIHLNALGADAVRRHLLDHYGAGTIAMGEQNLRVAFSSLNLDQVAPLFQVIYQACRDLAN